MSYTDPKDLIFKTSAEVKSFAKWYLGTTVESSVADEFKTEKERDEFLYRRASRLEVQVDNLRDLNFDYNIPASSQIFAAIARAKGIKGILYGSVRHQTKNNLVLFDENVSQLDLVCKLKNETEFDLDTYEMGLGIRKKHF